MEELRQALLDVFAHVRGAEEAITAAAAAAHDDYESFLCTLRDLVKHSDDLKYLRHDGKRKKATRTLLKRLRYQDIPPAGITLELTNAGSTDILGRGAFGDVYSITEYPELGAVAKVHRPKGDADNQKAEDRFRRDEAVTRRLTEKGCIRVPAYLGGGILPTKEKFFLMEYIEGKDLKREVKERGQLPLPEAAARFVELIRTLQEIHERGGVVHRDIKPENIKGTTVLDFGMAAAMQKDDTLADDATINLDLTGNDGRVKLGSPRYMSPDQFHNPSDKQPKNDYYSLALTFMEAVSGKLPRGDMPKLLSKLVVYFEELRLGMRQENFSILQGYPPETEEVARALMKGDTQTALTILEKLAQGEGNAVIAHIKKFGRRHPRFAVGGVIVTLASLMAAAGYGIHAIYENSEAAIRRREEAENNKQPFTITFPKNAYKSEDIELTTNDGRKLLIRSAFDIKQRGTGRIWITVSTIDSHEMFTFEGIPENERDINYPLGIVRRAGIDPKTQEEISHVIFGDGRQFIVRNGEAQAYLNVDHMKSPLMKGFGKNRWSMLNAIDGDQTLRTLLEQMHPEEFRPSLYNPSIHPHFANKMKKAKMDELLFEGYLNAQQQEEIERMRKNMNIGQPAEKSPQKISLLPQNNRFDDIARPMHVVSYTRQDMIAAFHSWDPQGKYSRG